MNHDRERLLVKIALLYHEQGLTQAEISEQLRLSRQKVQRILNEARKEGIVSITIRPIMGIFPELERELESRFSLSEAMIVESSNLNNQSAIVREVGVGAAEYLARVVKSNDKVVLSWGHSILGMVDALASRVRIRLQNVKLIQGLGGLGNPNVAIHGGELVRRAASALGAQPFLIPAPAVAASKAVRNAIVADPYVAQILKLAKTADLAFVGIGSADRDAINLPSLLQYLPNSIWSQLREKGAVGSINLQYFDRKGRLVPSPIHDRLVGLTLSELKKIPRVVGVAGGKSKLEAIEASMRAGFIDVLITDHLTAEALLK